jgi:GxxExxY protein
MEFESVSKEIIGCAIEVHRLLGPGLLESAYEECMVYELLKKGVKVERQKPIPVIYKEIKFDCGYRLDLLVENSVIIELKSIEGFAPVHEAQILTYMRFSNIKNGFTDKFQCHSFKERIKKVRFVIFVDLREITKPLDNHYLNLNNNTNDKKIEYNPDLSLIRDHTFFLQINNDEDQPGFKSQFCY